MGGFPAGNGEIRDNFVAALGPGWTSTAFKGYTLRVYEDIKRFCCEKSHFFGRSTTIWCQRNQVFENTRLRVDFDPVA